MERILHIKQELLLKSAYIDMSEVSVESISSLQALGTCG